MNLKSKMYRFLRTWNDFDAIRKGRVGKRIAWRFLGRRASKVISRLLR